MGWWAGVVVDWWDGCGLVSNDLSAVPAHLWSTRTVPDVELLLAIREQVEDLLVVDLVVAEV